MWTRTFRLDADAVARDRPIAAPQRNADPAPRFDPAEQFVRDAIVELLRRTGGKHDGRGRQQFDVILFPGSGVVEQVGLLLRRGHRAG